MEATAVIQARDDGAQEQGGGKGGDEQSLNLEHILKIKPIRVPGKLKARHKIETVSQKLEEGTKDALAINRDGECCK